MQRLNYFSHFKPGFDLLMDLERTIKSSSLDHGLIHLVKLYASQLNGCAFCVDMHAKEAKILGERELRIYHLPVWKESNLFTDREKAAFRWTKEVTELSQASISDESFQAAKSHFDDKELTELTMVIGVINVWNRFAATFHTEPGSMDKAMGLERASLA
ncbi:carboxymuconolactone decarboxylase family protein [Leptospira sp. 96542]|nr:carboxymuconolactone decarboxylase family protein [Leptospira sp. 96542]